MITALEIKNFKCFEHLRISLGKLTLLTGFNGGGKSSALQPLLLLSQTLRRSMRPRTFALNGTIVQLGTVGDVLPSDAGASTIDFKVYGDVDENSWILTARSGDRFLSVRVDDVREEPPDALELSQSNSVKPALAKLVYLSAVREGTADAFPIPSENSEAFDDIGMDGRFAAYWYDQFVDNEVPTQRCHPNEPATSLRKQLDAWIGMLFPGAQANVQLLPQVSLLSLQFRLFDTGPWRRPANIGYGLTYAFPILVALLAAEDDQIVVIDSPEAHLHPSAQSQMGRLLAHFAAAGVQIIVETHSDHLLNGVRLAVKERIVSNAALEIHFFTGATKDGHGVVSPTIDTEGRIDSWPEGFFDQSDKDLSLLTGWK